MMAYYEGYDYCNSGGKKEECPFPKKSTKRKLWLRGYEDCRTGISVPSLNDVGTMENKIETELTNEEE